MKYVVYQDDKRLSEYGIEGWEKDEFETFNEAVIMMFLWAYPITKEDAEQMAVDHATEEGKIACGEQYDFSMCEIPVLMSIKEIK